MLFRSGLPGPRNEAPSKMPPPSPGPTGLCHQRGCPAARPPAPGSEDPARPAGVRQPEFDREAGGGGGVSAPEADVSIWMGVVAAELPKRQPSAGTQLSHRLCSQRGGTGSRLHSASPPFGSPCTGRLGLPPRPLSRPAKLPRGARLGDYLEWQRSPAIGSVPAPSVGRDGANDQLPAKKKKKKSGPRRRQSSEASRAPQAAEARGHDARGLRSDLGSGRKKGVGLGVSSTKLRSQLANAWSAEERRGLGVKEFRLLRLADTGREPNMF